jgi:hypothetical protein
MDMNALLICSGLWPNVEFELSVIRAVHMVRGGYCPMI